MLRFSGLFRLLVFAIASFATTAIRFKGWRCPGVEHEIALVVCLIASKLVASQMHVGFFDDFYWHGGLYIQKWMQSLWQSLPRASPQASHGPS